MEEKNSAGVESAVRPNAHPDTQHAAGQYTRGPLVVLDRGGCETVLNFLAISRDLGGGMTSLPTAYVAREEDARLYAAAPELLEALHELTREYRRELGNEHQQRAWDLARAAIARAESAQ